MRKLKWLCAIVIIVGVATVASQIAAIVTVNGIVGYSEVKAVQGAVMPAADMQNGCLDFYKAYLKGEYPERPSLYRRMLTVSVGSPFETSVERDTSPSRSGSVTDTASSPPA